MAACVGGGASPVALRRAVLRPSATDPPHRSPPACAFLSSVWRTGFGGVIFSALFATVLSGLKADLTKAEQLVGGASGVSTVIVRPSGLTDGDEQGYSVAKDVEGNVGGMISRKDVARFMLSLATDARFDGRAVAVGGKLS